MLMFGHLNRFWAEGLLAPPEVLKKWIHGTFVGLNNCCDEETVVTWLYMLPIMNLLDSCGCKMPHICSIGFNSNEDKTIGVSGNKPCVSVCFRIPHVQCGFESSYWNKTSSWKHGEYNEGQQDLCKSTPNPIALVLNVNLNVKQAPPLRPPPYVTLCWERPNTELHVVLLHTNSTVCPKELKIGFIW